MSVEAVAYLGGFIVLVIVVLALCLRYTPAGNKANYEDLFWLDDDGDTPRTW